jgi:GrpB-like predicted nucleotidyltransferase (UPF0157 family)
MSSNEYIEIEPYDDEWPDLFKEEAKFLMEKLPQDILLEFHHIGSTAIPEMPAKPIIDIGVMVTSFDDAKEQIVPTMEELGYEYCWRTDRNPPFMTFIKRNGEGKRTFHVHMAEEEHNFWDRLYFREYLKKHQQEARNYFDLKMALSKQFAEDREAYTQGKEEYVSRITELAKKELDEF